MPHYQFVDKPDTLLPALPGAVHIGLDTEFMREKTYFPQLCLVQVATADEIYCIDPLVDGEHSHFWHDLFEYDWVVHSARQDIEVILHTSGAMPSSLFDTQVAAGLLGYQPQMGYAGLVKELFGVEMDKSHTRADWSRRPLREAWLQYAAEDVEYLLPAYGKLEEKLKLEGRLDWALEDSRLLLDRRLYEIDDAQAVDRLKGARNLRGRRRAAAARLAAGREREAIQRNRPRQWIARDTVLLEIAHHLPETERALGKIDGIPPKLVSRVGRALLEAVAASARDEHSYSPPSRPNESQKALLQEMQGRVAQCAAALDVSPEIIASRKELSAIIIAGSRRSRVFSGRGHRRRIAGTTLTLLRLALCAGW